MDKIACEHCGVDERITGNTLHRAIYYPRHNKFLCMRCVDKLNSLKNGKSVDEYWGKEDAKREGFPEFPMSKMKGGK